ncbi:hypothetical protein PCASD_06491 [Puccinia coronata f. sp. avenae]|uniref:Uncharacterized protein n=1 Tax=Puccinia coronata f. sp. avenae TaxID=200324 RepID=A0A2N5V1R4_9BASI|nr:hypothetical protein PCASD_06491 [Puccinia coronata f. sp. avenae]
MLELDEIGVFRICAGRDFSIEESLESFDLDSDRVGGAKYTDAQGLSRLLTLR